MAAGKMVAERTLLAREAQKKAAAEAAVIIARDKDKKATTSPSPDPALAAETEPKPAAADSNGLSTNQWLSIFGIGATLLTTFFGKKQATAPELAPQVTIHESPQPSRKTQPKKGIRPMD